MCTPEMSVGLGSTGKRSRANKSRHAIDDRPAMHPRAAQSKQGSAREERSDVDEDEEADTAWDECWGVRMSPENPCYVGRGDNICGGEVVYTIPEIKDLLRCHSEDVH